MQLDWKARHNDFYRCRLANDLKADLYYNKYEHNWNCNLFYLEAPIAFESFEEWCKTFEQAKEFARGFLRQEVARLLLSGNQALAQLNLGELE